MQEVAAAGEGGTAQILEQLRCIGNQSKYFVFLKKNTFKNNERKGENYLLKLYIILQGNVYTDDIASFLPKIHMVGVG